MEPEKKVTGLICENHFGPGYMGTPTALLHTELVGNQEYLPGSERKLFCHRCEGAKKGVQRSN